MYFRTTQRKNKDGSIVEYYHLAQNIRHPETKVSTPRNLLNFGRADQLDREEIVRLCESIGRAVGLLIHDPLKEEGDESTREIRARNSILRDGLVHMANLAIIGSKSVNGVAKLHSDILINETFKELYQLYPEKFNSKTNGVSHRRFLIKSNPLLTDAISKAIGQEWKNDPKKLNELIGHCDDNKCLKMLEQMKRNCFYVHKPPTFSE